MLRIRVGLLILYRLHLQSAFSSQCQKTRAVPFSSPLSSLPGEEKLPVAQKHLRWQSLLHYPPTGDKFHHLVSVANPVAHKTPALTASRVKSTFRPPRAWDKICLKEHSMQSDHAMGRQEGVSLLHWTSALVLKVQHLDKTQSCRQGGFFCHKQVCIPQRNQKYPCYQRANLFSEQCSLSAETLAIDAESTNESFLLPSFFSSSSRLGTKVH